MQPIVNRESEPSHSMFSTRQLQQAPESYPEHVFERSGVISCEAVDCWAWLCDPATFTDGQVWPYRVEFVGGGFEEGVLCNHSGPFIHFPGVISKVVEGEYRSLDYLYGAYVFTFRWIRPTRLEFWLQSTSDGKTEVRLRVTARAKAWIHGPWTLAQRLFWQSFLGWLRSGSRKKSRIRAAASGA